jgi:peptide-methionine (S)-S-oxide reductase
MTGSTTQRETATLAGGCFWCLEAVYDELRGVGDVVSGYEGGHVQNPTYRQVCGGDTGHAEVVQIAFDPSEISYRDLLQVFFTIHDPTTLNHSPEQKATAEQVISELNEAKVWGSPIVTEVVPREIFYPAEDYHQEYFINNSRQPYCMAVVAPKVAKARKVFLERLKKAS